MKIRVLFAIILLSIANITFAIEEKVINEKELPNKAQLFIETYFPNVNVVTVIEKQKQKIFYLRAADGKEFTFDQEGNWINVDCRSERVPSSLVPSPILNQVAKHYGTAVRVVQIAITKKGNYSLELSNYIRVKFDKHFNLIQSK